MDSNIIDLFGGGRRAPGDRSAAPDGALNETSRWLIGFASEHGLCAEAAKWIGEEFEKRWTAAEEEFMQESAAGFNICIPGNPPRAQGEAFAAELTQKARAQIDLVRSAYLKQLLMVILELALFRWPPRHGGGGGSREAA